MPWWRSIRPFSASAAAAERAHGPKTRENLPNSGHAAHSHAVSWLSRSLLLCPTLLSLGCASSQYPGIDDPMPPPNELSKTDAPVPGAKTKSTSAPGTLQRADVESVVDAGLGRFLSRVSLEPRVVSGKFAGWTIVALQPAELWQGVDLQPGDIVTRVNGMPIERETEAYDAFQAVRQAAALEVTYLRQNQPRTLRYTIVGAPSPALPKAAPAGAPKAGGSGPG